MMFQRLNTASLFILFFALSLFSRLESQELEMSRYTNQTVIVTGASKGIGKGLAKAYAREGARVVLVARNKATLEEVQNEILNAGGEAICFTADVSHPEAIQNLIDTTLDTYGKIDVLCHNAGIYPEKRLEEMQLEDWQTVIDVNLTETFFTESLMGLGEAYLSSMTQAIPANRLGTPEDIACAALFLTSNETNFITGQNLVVDGGQVLPESHFSEF